ncbi:glycosyltransferase [Agromyces sp. GXQ0307]|uniref:glycosyltransferase n=1 Tax=Agromyces sp. GXQ0307 TaxID=3377835 RepID=UPI00383B2DDE
MRIAVAKATLQIPPTYFAVQHAMALHGRFDFRFFTSAGDVRDPEVEANLSIHDTSRTVPALSGRSYPVRQKAAPLLALNTARAITRWGPDLIHQHFANLSGAAVRAHRSSGAPLLLTVHGADVYLADADPASRHGMARVLLPHHRRTVRRAFRDATSILAVSEYLAGRVIAAGADARKVDVHYQGIDTALYTPTDVPDDSGPPRVVFIGALSEAKGVRDLIAASTLVSRSAPHRLVLAGDGPLRGVVDAAAAEHPHIDVLGSVDRARIREILDGACVLALPTREWNGWREAAGLVTLEAQAMRVPVVVYDSGGAREMFDAERTGLLVPEGDVAALADGIRTIVRMPSEEHRELGRRAREFVVAERSLARSAEQLARRYENAAR